MEWTATVWWIIAAIALGVAELLVGTFYLLVLSFGALCAAYASYSEWSIDLQCTVFSLVVILGGLALTRLRTYLQKRDFLKGTAGLDVGQRVKVMHWEEDGTATVEYRGAQWRALADAGTTLKKGTYVIDRVEGSSLVLKNL